LGSGAPEIGRLVADKLRTDYIDREIIADVAKRLKWSKEGVTEKEMPPGTFLGRLAEALGRSGAYEGAYLPTWEIPLDDTSYLVGLESVIKELARSQSIVIRGRGSQFILKGYPNALHVLVVAPPELRVNRIMNSLNLDEEAARKEVARFDSSRREFTKRYFKAELEDPLHYDFVINTDHISFESAALIIVGVAPLKEQTT